MLLQGFSVPLKNKDLLFTTLGFYLEPGQNRMLQLAFRNQIYEIMLTNDAFDRVKYPEHKEIIQFRYNPSDALPVALREEYADSERDTYYVPKKKLPNGSMRVEKLDYDGEYGLVYALLEPKYENGWYVIRIGIDF